MKSLKIKETGYSVEDLEGGDVRITKSDGTSYVLHLPEQGRPTCTCPDFIYRHADKPQSPGCKHILACVARGGK